MDPKAPPKTPLAGNGPPPPSLESIRQKPTLTRIQEIFMEMDQLGNYTESRWMIELDQRSLYGFHRLLLKLC